MDTLAQFFKKKKTYLCKVVKINPTYVILQTAGISGICHISEISDYKVNDIHDFFEINQSYHFMLLEFDESKSLYNFSYKRINPKLLKHHSRIIPSVEGFNNLFDNTMKKLYEDK
ncbi:MAG: S1 RNA-binding domain-containing protein [Mycoplasmoidaceae bacterium]|nr:S1 RNA-binding domain-containing protein [Mycoplasmoidaceae bacterium]